MSGLSFENAAPVIASAPERADIACFVGYVRLRDGAAPPQPVASWLVARGWPAALTETPVPIDNWDVFDALFAWETRSAVAAEGSSYLGAAVRSFFAQGGRKCYVVRVGDSWSPLEPPNPAARLAALVPGYPSRFEPAPGDRRSWKGAGHVFGLPDVSFLCLPDLADAVSTARGRVAVPDDPPPPVPEFTECVEGTGAQGGPKSVRDLEAPRADENGYRDWALAVNLLGTALKQNAREAQLVAAVPLPAAGSRAQRNLPEFLGKYLDRDLDGGGVGSAFVQLAFPWVRTAGSVGLPEDLESPDAVLTGILARNALTRGSYRSVANLAMADVYDVSPRLRRDRLEALTARVTMSGDTPAGLRLLSDVTASRDENYRPANVNRLIAAIVRAARVIGEASVFEPSNEFLWSQLKGRLTVLLRGLFEAGALRGELETEAFSIRCDRSTMSQNDIDEGRVIVVCEISPAAPIESIRVVLALEDGGRISLFREAA
ncbi:MAG: phage tail sheath protein [Acidobacteria bacterium]|nr:phage tail sheath protein [Acidobacteriota bacterium]